MHIYGIFKEIEILVFRNIVFESMRHIVKVLPYDITFI